MLRQILSKSLEKKQKYLIFSNIVKCRPPQNRTPTEEECQKCSTKFLILELQKIQPNFILCAGKTSYNTIIKIFNIKNLDKQWTFQIFQKENTKILSFYHPSFLLYQTIERRNWLTNKTINFIKSNINF